MTLPVLVIGASGGIGGATTRQLAASGHSVFGIDRVPPHDPDLYASFEVADIVSDDGQATAARLIKDRGPVWGVVYCAGIYPMVDLDNYTLPRWDDVHSVNVRAAFQLVQQLRSSMMRGGRIVLVSSEAAQAGSRDAAYASSKAGLIGLMKSLARTLAPDGVLVNAVAPGVIDTPMSHQMLLERRREHIDRTALGRAGTADEVAAVIGFLLQPSNSYMTGATLDVNGGLYLR